MRLFNLLIFSLFFMACIKKETEKMGNTAFKTIGQIVKVDDRLDNIITAGALIEVLADGYSWSEGPVWVEKEGILIWSDVPKNIAYRWKPGEQAREYLKPSGYSGADNREGSNGLLLNADGQLVLCQHGDRRVAVMEAPIAAPEARFKTIADNYNGKKFNSPNDAVFDNKGNLYFTDPPYGLPGEDDNPQKELTFSGVFRVSADGQTTLLDNALRRPNGIAFNPDFSKCYVANSDEQKAIWKVYDVDENGIFQNGRIFYDATSMVSAENKGLPDGLKVNNQGIVFATGPGGVLIFSPEGEHLGTIRPGVAVANCAFNDDQSVLFLTADNYVCRVKLN